MTHQPVLLAEVLHWLKPKPGEIAADFTVNRGGHSSALCQTLGQTGKLIGLDADEEALAAAKENLRGCPCSVLLLQNNFRNLDQALIDAKISTLDIALFDLGLSSEQLATAERGFSFQQEGPLQMTLATKPEITNLTAEKIVNHWPEAELAEIFRAYGEERFARPIAQAIADARRHRPLTSTGQLVEIIRQAVPSWYTHRRLHFATKTFQALRLVVNDELKALKEGLTKVWNFFRPGSRLAVISFHRLEARIVKEKFRQWKIEGVGRILTPHAIKPGRAEILANPRARSAQLRIITKIK